MINALDCVREVNASDDKCAVVDDGWRAERSVALLIRWKGVIEKVLFLPFFRIDPSLDRGEGDRHAVVFREFAAGFTKR